MASASHTHSARALGSLSVAAVNRTRARVVEDSASEPPTPSRSIPAHKSHRRRNSGSSVRRPAAPQDAAGQAEGGGTRSEAEATAARVVAAKEVAAPAAVEVATMAAPRVATMAAPRVVPKAGATKEAVARVAMEIAAATL